MNQDRLGSVGKYLPYGEDKPGSTNPGNDSVKFATYTRDANTGIDYADQRWHAQGTGRFLTADPYQASAGAEDPGSWNRYGYVGGDPVGRMDATGEYYCAVSGSTPTTENLTNRTVSVSCISSYANLPWFVQNDFAYHVESAVVSQQISDDEVLSRANRIAKSWEMSGFNWYMRLQAQSAIRQISSECVAALEGRAFEGTTLTMESLWNQVRNTDFWDAERSYVANMPMAYFGGGTGETVAQFLSRENASAFTAWDPQFNRATSIVVLGRGVSTSNTTLVHEMLHVFTGLGDLDLAISLGYKGTDERAASRWISEQLNNKCTGVNSK